jgi:ankyrin repeat protein
MLASLTGQTSAVDRLLAAGADVHLQSSSQGWTALFCAAMKSHEDIVVKLLQAGADPNDKNVSSSTPLCGVCVQGCSPAIVGLLLEAGADVNATNGLGHSPLFEASSTRHANRLEVVQTLLAGGADVNQVSPDQGLTPIFAARKGDVAHCLVTAGADVNARNAAGATPLIWSTTKLMELAVVDCLLTSGADVNARDANNNTALIAAFQGTLCTFVLMKASMSSQREIDEHFKLTCDVTDLLLRSGAHIDGKNSQDETALSTALQCEVALRRAGSAGRLNRSHPAEPLRLGFWSPSQSSTGLPSPLPAAMGTYPWSGTCSSLAQRPTAFWSLGIGQTPESGRPF